MLVTTSRVALGPTGSAKLANSAGLSMKPLILKAPAGVTTILRRPPTRSKPKEKKSHASRTNCQRDGAGGTLEAGEGPGPENWRTVRRGAGGHRRDPGRPPA